MFEHQDRRCTVSMALFQTANGDEIGAKSRASSWKWPMTV